MSVLAVQKALRAEAIPEKALFFPKFFKSGPGEYAEGDKFLGVTVPKQRAIAKTYFQKLSLQEAEQLLKSEWHEERLVALFILVLKYQKGDLRIQQDIYDFYLSNSAYVNNWDLVDSSAPYIVGDWLLGKDRKILYKLAKSKILWERRIAIIATLWFIRKGEFVDTIMISEQLLSDKHDLIHKAVGWALREMGKRAPELLIDFLDKHAAYMPRTALRYAIEHLSSKDRLHYLGLKTP